MQGAEFTSDKVRTRHLLSCPIATPPAGQLFAATSGSYDKSREGSKLAAILLYRPTGISKIGRQHALWLTGLFASPRCRFSCGQRCGTIGFGVAGTRQCGREATMQAGLAYDMLETARALAPMIKASADGVKKSRCLPISIPKTGTPYCLPRQRL
jgi:hypothetical protein